MGTFVQSLKTIGESNLDLEQTQALRMGGGYLGIKTTDIKQIFQKLSPLTLKRDRKPEDNILIHFAVRRKSR